MRVFDLEGETFVTTEEDLLARLERVRSGPFGIFILSHSDSGPSLWVHINNDVAYLHYFPDGAGDHPGFQPEHSKYCAGTEQIRFILTDAGLDPIFMAKDHLVATSMAYAVAKEYLKSDRLPPGISWFEL